MPVTSEVSAEVEAQRVNDIIAAIVKECEGKGINYIHKDGCTAIEIAAMNNEHAVVDILISQHGASRKYAVAGYARAGNHDKVEEHVRGLIALEEHTPYAFAVRGYAQAGTEEAKVKEFVRANRGYRNFAIEGSALGRHHDKLSEYMLAGEVHNFYATRGYAMAGADEYVNEALKIAPENNIVAALAGYAMTGRDEKVSELLKLLKKYGKSGGGCILLESYALAGNHKKVEEWIEKDGKIYDAVLAYAKAGNHNKVDEFISRGAFESRIYNESDKADCVRAACRGYMDSGDLVGIRNMTMHVPDIGFSGYRNFVRDVAGVRDLFHPRNPDEVGFSFLGFLFKRKDLIAKFQPLFSVQDKNGQYFSAEQVFTTPLALKTMINFTKVSKIGLDGELRKKGMPYELISRIFKYVCPESMLNLNAFNSHEYRKASHEMHENTREKLPRLNYMLRALRVSKPKIKENPFNGFVNALAKENKNSLVEGKFGKKDEGGARIV